MVWIDIPDIADVSCYVLVLTGFLLGKPALCNNEKPTAATKSGVVEGYVDNVGNYVWKGIPYAATTAGKNRWKAPQKTSWTKKRTSTSYGPTCPQAYRSDFKFSSQSEDCLNLNIWAPSSGKGLPVLVYIYGGAMVTGSNSNPGIAGTHFAERDVVYVNINHRMNLFGFPNSPELSSSSSSSQNFGILDVEAALKWVHDNIKSFGGDPDHIVIAGHSSGSVMVDHYLWNNPKTFLVGAVQMSGNAQSGPAVAPSAVGLDALASEVGCPAASAGGQLACMREVDFLDFETTSYNASINTWFTPVLDSITRFPSSTYATRSRPKIPLVVGTADAEGAVFQFVYGGINDPFTSWIKTFDADSAHIPATELVAAYDNDASRSGEQYGDARFQCPTEHLVNLRAGGQSVWQYRWMGAGSVASHGSEVPYFHGGYDNFDDPASATTAMQETADGLIDWLVEFVKDPEAGPGWGETSTGTTGELAVVGVEGKGAAWDVKKRGDYNQVCRDVYEDYFNDYPVIVDPSA